MAANLFDEENLNKLNKDQIIAITLKLQKENTDYKSLLEKRVVELERNQYLFEQYGRRESVEISGIPTNIPNGENLEIAVINVYNEAKIQVHGKSLEQMDITACHRIGKKGVTICRFVNRKYAFQGLTSGKNLKGTKLFGEDSAIYINNSFCREFARYGWLIRTLKKRKHIEGYMIRSGVYKV